MCQWKFLVLRYKANTSASSGRSALVISLTAAPVKPPVLFESFFVVLFGFDFIAIIFELKAPKCFALRHFPGNALAELPLGGNKCQMPDNWPQRHRAETGKGKEIGGP